MKWEIEAKNIVLPRVDQYISNSTFHIPLLLQCKSLECGGGEGQMITVLHRGWGQMITELHKQGGRGYVKMIALFMYDPCESVECGAVKNSCRDYSVN